MPPIIDATVSMYGEPESWTEELFAATRARWPVWLLVIAVIAGLMFSGYMVCAAFLAVVCGVFSVALPDVDVLDFLATAQGGQP